MRQIKAGDKFELGVVDLETKNFKGLETKNFKDLEFGDIFVCGCIEHMEYFEFTGPYNDGYRNCAEKSGNRFHRVPRPNEKTEPRNGILVDASKCPTGSKVKWEDYYYIVDKHDDDGGVRLEGEDYAEWVEPTDQVLLISKGDEEILEAACSSGKEYPDGGLLIPLDAAHDFEQENPDAVQIGRDGKFIRYKKRKKSPHPGDITELRNCQMGWIVSPTIKTVAALSSLLMGSDYKITKINEDRVWLNSEIWIKPRRKFKLISKGDQKEMVRVFQVNGKEHYLTIAGANTAIGQGCRGEINEVMVTKEFAKLLHEVEGLDVNGGLKEGGFLMSPGAAKEHERIVKEIAQQSIFTKDPHEPTRWFQEDVNNRPVEVVEEVKEQGRSYACQTFVIPEEFILEMLQRVNGLPSDIVFNTIDEDLLFLLSKEFMNQDRKLRILRDGDGWKVEGT